MQPIVYVIEPRVAGTFEERQEESRAINKEVVPWIHRYFAERPRTKPRQHHFREQEHAERAMASLLLAKPHLKGKVRVTEMDLGWCIIR